MTRDRPRRGAAAADQPAEAPDSAPARDDLVDRGPVETLAPSRTALALVGAVGLVLAILAGAGILNVSSGRDLGEGVELVHPGVHEFTVGPVTLTAELAGSDWIVRQRCDRWVQLTDARNDSSRLHVVWLDAVPLPSNAPTVELVPTPDDMASWWRQRLDLAVTRLPAGQLDGHEVARYQLDATPAARRLDGLFACGRVGGPAGIGMYGPAARFDQQVALVDVEGTPLLLVAAAYTGGDVERLERALDTLVASGELATAPDVSATASAAAR